MRRGRRWRRAACSEGAALTGALGLVVWRATDELGALSVMGSGYGTLQAAVGAGGSNAPTITLLVVLALGKILATALTIGSGGVFGPSMVIGGSLGALVGSLFHAWMPAVVPEIGPFAIVGMAGVFAGAANTAKRWTLYPEQVPTRAQSGAHRGDLLIDVLQGVSVADLFQPRALQTVPRAMPLRRDMIAAYTERLLAARQGHP